MIEITERITRVTTNVQAGRSQIAIGERTPAGARVTLEFSRSVALSSGQAVRLRYDLAGNGRLHEFSGIAQLTHTVARRGRLVVFHYRLSQWITASTLSLIRETSTAILPAVAERAVDQTPA